MTQARVSAADLVRNFALWRETALREPVQVTSHGRETHVLLSSAKYTSLADLEKSAGTASDLDRIRGLAEWLDDAVVLCDSDGVVLFANRVATAICRCTAGELTGKPLLAALPATQGSLFETQSRRTLLVGEPTSADIPSPFREGAWLRFQGFALGTINVLMFRDITDEVTRHRLADMKAAIMEAVEVLGDTIYVRLSVRGTIDHVSLGFCEMLGISEQRLLHVPLADFIPVQHRVTIRETLEDVLRGDGHRQLSCAFLTNRGELTAMRLAIVQLKGAYGCEGAIVLGIPGHEDAVPLAPSNRKSAAG
jgi:PAS domain-containing protein